MDLKDLYHRLHREPADFPLFARIWEVLRYAPAAKHADEEEMVSLAADALDYLKADGKWRTWAVDGGAELTWDGRTLQVHEDNNGNWHYQRSFTVINADGTVPPPPNG